MAATGIAKVVEMWCRTAGTCLEGNWLVELVKGRQLAEVAPPIAVALIMGTL